MTLLTFIPSITAGCFLMMAFLLWINPMRVNIKANKWLAGFVLCMAFLFLNNPYYFSDTIISNPIYLVLGNACLFLSAPTLYFTITFFISPLRVFVKKDLWHFFLFFFVLIVNAIGQFIPENLAPTQFPESKLLGLVLGLSIIIIPIAIYWIVCYKKLLRHQNNLLLFSSNTEQKNLEWLRFLLIGIIATIPIWMLQISNINVILTYIANLVYLIFAFFVAYYSFKQKEIYTIIEQENVQLQTLLEENDLKPIVEPAPTNKKQIFTDEELQLYKQKLLNVMEADKPYLDSEIGLLKLATAMELTAHELSFVINTGFDDNFNGFINKYRVQYSQELLLSGKFENLSILGIAFEAGFNSKTAFNTAFKKIVGMSPSEFVKANKK